MRQRFSVEGAVLDACWRIGTGIESSARSGLVVSRPCGLTVCMPWLRLGFHGRTLRPHSTYVNRVSYTHSKSGTMFEQADGRSHCMETYEWKGI